MNNKRTLSILIIFVMLIGVLSGCSQSQVSTNTNPEWVITIEGTDEGTVEFTNIVGEEIGLKEITATLKKKDGSEVEQNWQGYGLKEVLEYYGVKEFSSVIVEAQDGYNKEYTPELVNSEGTILGIILDGENLSDEDNKVQLVVKEASGNMWIKGVAKIIVNK